VSYSFEQFQSLQGQRLKLRRVHQQDLAALALALISPTTWFTKTRSLDSVESFSAYFQKLLIKQEKGELLALVAEYEGQLVAMSVYQYPSEGFRRVEIGFTWIADKWQRTFVNSEMKLLMLDYAFDSMKVSRVEFSVHPTNERSNASMRRLGATLEGTLRKWRFLPGLVPDDGNRNLYSIIDDEWPEIRRKLA
jgi:N-acetyltransferase